MHIITRSRLVEFWEKHPDAKTSLLLWYKLTISADWQNFVEVRKVFPSADRVKTLHACVQLAAFKARTAALSFNISAALDVKNFTIFNVGGNKYRLIVFIDYMYQHVFIRYVLTHAEYDKDDWKKDDWYE